MKIKLSVVIITFNEERNIEPCLKAASVVADDIVVLDSFSTDKTQEICNRYSVRFFQHAFDDYVNQKNRATELATYNYVLSLDADEVLSNELTQSILQVKNNWTSPAYSLKRLTNYCGNWIKHCGWYPDTKLRMWDRRLGKWQGEMIHESLEMNDQTMRPVILKGDLLHYSYHTIFEHIAQINKFTEIGAIADRKKGKKSNLIKITVNPIWKFIHMYIIKKGFLDGYYGFVISINSAFATFIKYIKIREKQNDVPL